MSDDVLTMAGLRHHRMEILRAARRRRARRVAVFGSVARGEAGPDSDLDLLVDFEPGASLLDHVGLVLDLENLLGVGVDIVTQSSLKPRDGHLAKRLEDSALGEFGRVAVVVCALFSQVEDSIGQLCGIF